MTEHETVRALRTNIGLAGKEGRSKRLRYPPPLEQFGFGPRIENDMRRAVEGSSHDELTLGLPFHGRGVLCGVAFTISCFVHRLSPFVLIPRQACPTR